MYAAGSLAAGAAVLGRFGLGNDWLATHLDPVDGDGSDPADDGSDGGDGSVIGGGLGKGALAGAAGRGGRGSGARFKGWGDRRRDRRQHSSDAAKANPALTGSGCDIDYRCLTFDGHTWICSRHGRSRRHARWHAHGRHDADDGRSGRRQRDGAPTTDLAPRTRTGFRW